MTQKIKKFASPIFGPNPPWNFSPHPLFPGMENVSLSCPGPQIKGDRRDTRQAKPFVSLRLIVPTHQMGEECFQGL